jgi:hypothetical protein
METIEMEIEQVVAWRTRDGVLHPTKEMADQHIANKELVTYLQDCGYSKTAQDIVNAISGNRMAVRNWLDATDAMERALLNG